MKPDTALITGATRGIGRAVAIRLARDGYDIGYCYARDDEAAAGLDREIHALGRKSCGFTADVADRDAVRELVETVEDALGPVTAVVASAATLRDKPVALMKAEDWDRVLRVDLGGVHHVCQAALDTMMRRRRGSIVTMSSLAGLRGNAGQANYAAAKAGIIGYTKSLAQETGRYGIRANVVAPGFIATDLVEGLPQHLLDQVRERTALRRLGTPGEIADVIAFLLSDQASFMTGEVLTVDGGMQ
ncbi:3-oxoacyl-[acyl-carrier-protein] reductase [Luteococcus sediminum]|uniref:3-oxoacyl-ACP reductase FabG n=1 Tax=Luteococcus sp. TaxID=1969402 RepID=UPI003736E32C